MLLTALLVLAILASSTLVFTNRVELLRLAVILSLWAAVMAAFVTVIYRRQSDVAQARARDMKFVYDLQLDREISARREYELSVEARLRRQLSREGVQAADEMAALRAELSALRSQLEVMLGADLAPRPALESERIAVPLPSAQMPPTPMPPAPGRVESSRVTVVTEEIVTVSEETEYVTEEAVESPIIDVAEEPVYEEPAPVPPPAPEPPVWGPYRRPAPEKFVPPPPPQPEAPWRPPEVRLGRHSTGDAAASAPRPEPVPPPAPPGPPPRGRHWVPPAAPPNPAGRHRPADQVAEEPPAEKPAKEKKSARGPVDEPDQQPVETRGQHADGQSFADLMQRLHVESPAKGGRRRRKED